MESQKVRIFDTTLRDGEQTPGVSITPEQKLNVAIKLADLGVDTIEAGFPVVSDGEKEGIKNIVKQKLDTEVCVLARTVKADIDSALDCGVNYVHTFIATSDIHMQYKLKMSREQVMEKALWAVEYAKSHGLKVEFSAEDATRSDRKFLIDVFKAVTDSGADRIDIPDTVGYSTPEYITSLVQELRSKMNTPISVHCHNDFGLAVANSIAAINSGASCAHVTINGLGERAGNASLEEFVMALQCLYSKKHNIKVNLLYEISKFGSNTMGVVVQPNKAIIGENAFGHESGIHTHGVLNNPLTYEPISPELVGRKRWLQVGKHAGIHGMNAMLAEYGIHPTDDQAKQILDKVKIIGDQGKQITDVELLAIAGEVMQQPSLKRLVHLTGFSVSTGIGNMPYAFVKLNIEGKDFIGTDYGVGPVDASINAIQKITGEIAKVRIKDYKLDSISGGSDALCEVTIKVEDAYGNLASAKSIGEDIVITSVQAMIDGINRIMLKNILKQKNLGN